MIRVNVEYLPLLPDITGRRVETVEVETPTLGGLLEALDQRYGEKWCDVFWHKKGEAISPHIMVVLNGCLVRDLSAPLANGNTVVITPAVSGG